MDRVNSPLISVALVRPPPTTFSTAICGADVPLPIDLQRANRQHSTYVGALAQLGLSTHVVPPDPTYPDCCFIEDSVVLTRGTALVTRSGAASRRGESKAVDSALRPFLGGAIHYLRPPATLDGGDVLCVGRTIFVGLSARTNRAGVRALESCFAPLDLSVCVIRVPKPNLHLKCFCSTPAPGVVLLAEDTVDPLAFADHAEVWMCPAEEAYAANTVGVAGGVLVAAGFPQTARLLGKKGLRVIAVDVSEFRKRDGSLTCLSVLF